jgi:hypothetical protein
MQHACSTSTSGSTAGEQNGHEDIPPIIASDPLERLSLQGFEGAGPGAPTGPSQPNTTHRAR